MVNDPATFGAGARGVAGEWIAAVETAKRFETVGVFFVVVAGADHQDGEDDKADGGDVRPWAHVADQVLDEHNHGDEDEEIAAILGAPHVSCSRH